MADVAVAVGVSKTTISRYLHGDYEFMSEETRKKIQDVVEELNYRPKSSRTKFKIRQIKLYRIYDCRYWQSFFLLTDQGCTIRM